MGIKKYLVFIPSVFFTISGLETLKEVISYFLMDTSLEHAHDLSLIPIGVSLKVLSAIDNH
jgi:hypothetical protein